MSDTGNCTQAPYEPDIKDALQLPPSEVSNNKSNTCVDGEFSGVVFDGVCTAGATKLAEE